MLIVLSPKEFLYIRMVHINMQSENQITTKVDSTVELSQSELETIKGGEPLSKNGVLFCPEDHTAVTDFNPNKISASDKYSYSAIYELDNTAIMQLSDGEMLLLSPDYSSPVLSTIMDSVLVSQK